MVDGSLSDGILFVLLIPTYVYCICAKNNRNFKPNCLVCTKVLGIKPIICKVLITGLNFILILEPFAPLLFAVRIGLKGDRVHCLEKNWIKKGFTSSSGVCSCYGLRKKCLLRTTVAYLRAQCRWRTPAKIGVNAKQTAKQTLQFLQKWFQDQNSPDLNKNGIL